MPGNTVEPVEQSIAISDPGELKRDQQVWGDRLMVNVANVLAWLFPLLMIAIVIQVVIRKFGFNQAWLDDAQWWMYGVAMLTGFGYAITTESHVRVDIFYQGFNAVKRAKIEIFGLGWLLAPFLILMTDVLIHYAAASWKSGEGSDSPNGLHRLYLLKTVLPILFTLAIVAAGAVIRRHLGTLTAFSLWKFILATLPACWFLGERTIHYILWWYIRFSQPDLLSRRISKQPLLEHSFWLGLALVAVILAGSFLATRKSTERG